MIDSIFTEDMGGDGWEVMLAELRGKDLKKTIEELKAEAWELWSEYSYKKLPLFRETYSQVLLEALADEIANQIGDDQVDFEIIVKRSKAKFLMDKKEINNLEEYKAYLADITGLNQLKAVIDKVLVVYEPNSSAVLSVINTEGKDQVITKYAPSAKELKAMDIGIDRASMAQELKWAIAAGKLLKIFIEDHIISEHKDAVIDVGMYGGRINVNVLKNGNDLIIDYDNIYNIIDLKPQK